MEVIRIGLDIAKHVFQVHGVDEYGTVVVRKQLIRSKVLAYFAQLPACRIGLAACGSAHDWRRELQKLGQDVRLMAVPRIKPYRTKPKNDRNEAEAICEAVSRPQMRCVPIKTVAQQAVLTVHRARELLVSERTVVANQIRGRLLPSRPSTVTPRAARRAQHRGRGGADVGAKCGDRVIGVLAGSGGADRRAGPPARAGDQAE